MDETGFRIGCGKAQLVVTMDPNKPLRMIDRENYDYITSVECIGSGDETIPPMLVISTVNILHKWCQDNNLDGETLIGNTETGYANKDTALDWLRLTIDPTQNKRRGEWLLLIIDGYGSHITIVFHNLATANKIVLFQLPPHSTYLTQPLDVGVFQLFKHYYIDAIDKAVRLGDEKFGKLEFLSAFQSFCNETFKSSTIWHAFKSTGLVPFNLDVVLDKSCEKQAQRQQTALRILFSPLLPLNQSTSQGPASVVKYGQKLQGAYAKLKPWEKIDPKQIQRFIRRLIASAYILELTKQDLKAVPEATTACAKHASFGGQVVQKSGTIKVSECRSICSKRKEKEEEQARKRKVRDEKRAEKQANSQLAQIEFFIRRASSVE